MTEQCFGQNWPYILNLQYCFKINKCFIMFFLLNVFKFVRQPSLQRDNYLIKALTWNKKNKDSLTDIENCLLAILVSF